MRPLLCMKRNKESSLLHHQVAGLSPGVGWQGPWALLLNMRQGEGLVDWL